MPDLSLATNGTAIGLATALGLGLLVGVERERSKGDGAQGGPAGVRTFSLIALAGAIAQLAGPVGIGIAGLFVTLAAMSSYRRSAAHDPGLTTEVAMLVVFLLGLLSMRAAALAAGIGVVVAVLLAGKTPMHRFTRDRLTSRELQDGLILVASAFVILPLLPDRTIDPWHSINPRRLWILVIAVMSVSTVGYLALRLLGPRLGLALAGLAGGFVSSTATIATMADKAREAPALAPAFAGAGLLSNVATIVQMAIVLAALSPPLLAFCALPLLASGAAAAAAAFLLGWRALASTAHDVQLGGKHPFDPVQVLTFVGLLAAVVLVAGLAREWLGDRSLPWVLAASGLADVHAATASAAQLVASDTVGLEVARFSIAAALATNSLMKCLFAVLKGGRAYAWRLVPGIALMVLAFVVTSLRV